jgi:thioredoxin 1
MNRTLAAAVAITLFFSAWAGISSQAQGGPPVAKEPAAPAAPAAALPLPRMVDLGKTWCIPCKKMVAVLEEAELRYKGTAAIEFIDLDDQPEAAAQYKVMMIPTQIFYTADGKEFERHRGYLSFEEVEKIFAKMGVKRSS